MLNNPLRYTDPTGFFTEEAIAGYLYDNYDEHEADRLLSEWKGDEALWDLLLDAEAGDVMLVQVHGRDRFFTFRGEGQDKLFGIVSSDIYGNGQQSGITLQQIAADERNGWRSYSRSYRWYGTLRPSNSTIHLRIGYKGLVAEYTKELRDEISITSATFFLAAPAGLPVEAAMVYGLVGIGISHYGPPRYFDALHMNEGDKWLYIVPQSANIGVEDQAGLYSGYKYRLKYRGNISLR